MKETALKNEEHISNFPKCFKKIISFLCEMLSLL